jgi:hypothetical protein
MRYFIHNLETDKLEIHTGGKADWLSLPEADRDEIKRSCLWSGSRGCWVSRAKSGGTGFYFLRQHLPKLGFEDRGTEGARLTFAEQVAAIQERAESRADRMEDRADDARREAESRFKAERAILEHIPMGQPILVGHHSEKRHRSDLARADNHMRKAVEATEKRDHYRQRAAAARATAEGKQFGDPGYLQRRIREAEAEERLLLRRLEGKFYAHSEARPISDEYREQLTAALEECRDKLGFYRQCLEDCGGTAWNRETLKGKTFVLIRGRWEQIVRCNPTTVSVYNSVFPTEESQRKWPLKYQYGDVQDAR